MSDTAGREPGPGGPQGYGGPPAYGPPGYRAGPPWAAPPAGPPPWVAPPTGPPPYSSTPYAEPQPYLRLLRTRRYRWWRPLVGLFVAMAAFLFVGFAVYGTAAVAGVAAGGAEADVLDRVTDLGSPLGLLLANLTLAGGILAAWVAVVAAHQERIGWLSSVQGRIRWRWLALNAALAVAVIVPTYLAYVILPADADLPGGSDAAWPGVGTFLTFLLIILLTTPLQAAGEEYAFRGYLSQALGAWIRWPIVPVLASTALFALAHGTQGPWLFADRFAFGLAASWLTIRTGGLEAAIALHAVNNAIALTFAAALGELPQAFTLTDIPLSIALIDIAALVVFAAFASRLARSRGIAVRSVSAAAGAPGLDRPDRHGHEPGGTPGTAAGIPPP
jgi:membrane protease YdiL (CAAX protease family)